MLSALDYDQAITPSEYRCKDCDAHGVRLWREYNTFMDYQVLRCIKCACKNQGKDVSNITDEGKLITKYGDVTDQIGWLVPAVPTEDGESMWGYTSVPQSGVNWWYSLPVVPE